MKVQFRRTGDRRYAVTIIRPECATLEMNPAPGYDARLPHDLVHFVVERELGLRHGIFGQLAAGGTAGTFHATPGGETSPRKAARGRRALARRGAKLLRQGTADAAMSERLADVCRRAWLARTAGATVRVGEGLPLSAEDLDRVCDVFDELSAAWASLEVGQALTLNWVDEATNR